MSDWLEQAGTPLPEPLPEGCRIVDTHCHLDMCTEHDGPRVDEALATARSLGVHRIVQVGCDVAGSRRSVAIAQAHPEISAAVALHPNEAPRVHAEGGLTVLEAAWREIGELACDPAVVAVGETGLDFFRTPPEGRAVQEESFRHHINLAKQLDKTLVVHDRDAHADVLRVLDDEGAPDRVVMHCFSGDSDFARAASERGWYCSFAGVVTFKNAQGLRDALAIVPSELVLVETDAPFLTPTPYRGKLNGSYLLPLTVRAMADVREVSVDELCQYLWDNSLRAFGLAASAA